MASRSIGPTSWAALASVTLHFGINVSGAGIGNFPPELPDLQIDFSVFNVQTIDLASGPNTINLPISATNVKATGVFIVMPENGSVLPTLKGIAGDTGIPLNREGIGFIPFDTVTPPTSFVINAASAIAGVVFLWV